MESTETKELGNKTWKQKLASFLALFAKIMFWASVVIFLTEGFFTYAIVPFMEFLEI